MNTSEIAELHQWDETDIQLLVGRFVRVFRRLPNAEDLRRLRRAQSHLHLRIPAQSRRRLGRVIATW